MHKLTLLVLSLGILLKSHSAFSVEIYSFLTSSCRLTTGLILSTEEDNVEILSLSGDAQSLSKPDIDFLIVHNTLDNPFEKIKTSQTAISNLLDIYIGDSDKALFTGWAVRFIEDLIIFYDIKGNSHVIEIGKINKIRPAHATKLSKLKEPLNRTDGEPMRLNFGNIFFKCPELANQQTKNNVEAILPTRTLGDKVQITEFLSNFESGFRKLKSYQERTYLYARPFLYEKKTKLGFTSYDSFHQNVKSEFPFYYQWSTGEAYRFQSFNQIGNVPNELVPTPEPFFLVRSDVKSHLFHASFVGNLSALPAGTDFYTDQRENIDKTIKTTNRIRTAPSLNYMALMGADYGPWSFSFGTYYPIFMMRYLREDHGIDFFREVLASKVSPIFRIMYTTKRLKVRGLYSQTTYEESIQPNDKQISIDNEISAIGILNSFNFESHFFRLGGDYQLTDKIQVSLDQIVLISNYSELTSTNVKSLLDFDHYITSFSIRHWFGEKVTLRLYANYVKLNESINIGTVSQTEKLNELALGGAFEFVF